MGNPLANNKENVVVKDKATTPKQKFDGENKPVTDKFGNRTFF